MGKNVNTRGGGGAGTSTLNISRILSEDKNNSFQIAAKYVMQKTGTFA
jgi:hypothetical protein